MSSPAVVATKPIYCYQSKDTEMTFLESKTEVFARVFFKGITKNYPLDPSYLNLTPSSVASQLTGKEIIPWLFENNYVPFLQDEKVQFQRPQNGASSSDDADPEEMKSSSSSASSSGAAKQPTLEQGFEGPNSFFDNRETRSNLSASAEMILTDFDPNTGEMTCQFTSEDDYQKHNQILSDRMAAFTNYAGARSLAKNAGTMESIPTLTWIQKALKATADQLQQEKYGETSTNYRSQAAEVDNALQEKGKAYKESIKGMKKELKKEKSDRAFLEYFRKARDLKPNAFEPFYFLLIPFTFLASKMPQTFKDLLKEAYEISPIQTFNCLMTSGALLSMRTATVTDNILADMLRAFHARFPVDVAVIMVINDATTKTKKNILEDSEEMEKSFRAQFAHQLEKALTAIKNRDLKSAREEFSAAAHYNIFDKRSYMYRALIDLQAGDLLSARKQMTELGQVIRWNDSSQRNRAISRFLEYLENEEQATIKSEAPAELPVLMTLLKIFSSNEIDSDALKNFYEAMKVYLTNQPADPLWAQLAIELSMEQIGGIEACLRNEEVWNVFLNLGELIPQALFLTLLREEEDLTEFEGFFSIDEEGHLQTAITVRVTAPSLKQEPLCICPRSFELLDESRVSFLKNILDDSYVEHCLQMIRIGCGLENMSDSLLKDVPEDHGAIDGRFVAALLDRNDREGTEELRAKFIHWACKHFSVFPESKKVDLTESAFRWQLDLPVPLLGAGPVTEATGRWLSLLNKDHSPKHQPKNSSAPAPSAIEPDEASSLSLSSLDLSSEAVRVDPSQQEILEPNKPLRLAFKTWTFIHEGSFEKAGETLESFFGNWESHLSEDLDPIALRALCLARALLDNKSFFQPQIFSSLSEVELELTGHALSMIAREGVIAPYVIPDQPISKETLRKICHLYLGQKRAETNEAYEKRLQKSQIPDLSNLRQAKHFKDMGESESPDKDWIVPFFNINTTKRVREIIREMTERHHFRMAHNRQIGDEKPEYSQDLTFINWVTSKTDLVTDYLADPLKVKGEFNRLFPLLPGKNDFFAELEEKAKHEIDFRKLKEHTPHAEKDTGKRFWQLVNQTAALTKTVTSSKRSDVSFDLYVMNKEEALFVMQLIYEGGLGAWGDQDIQKFAEAFHGPEIHIWGKGPRIPHFNAGIYLAGKEKPINVHIFYLN